MQQVGNSDDVYGDKALQALKAQLRKDFKSKRNAIHASVHAELSSMIVGNVLSSDFFRNARIVMLYASINNEVDTHELIDACFALNKKVVVPVMRNSEIIPSLISSSEDLHTGFYGIPESLEIVPVRKDDIDVVIVPLLAFDARGHRIGYGKGHFDKFLKGFNNAKVGIAFSVQQAARIPVEQHDVPLDFVITEEGVLKCR